MKIINPSVTIMNPGTDPQKHIEKIARVCYKSTDLITEDSNKRFIKNIVNRKHWAMIEHYIFIYKIPYSLWNNIHEFAKENNISLGYIKLTVAENSNGKDERYLISFNARSILDLIEKFPSPMNRELSSIIDRVIYDYGCEELFMSKEYERLKSRMVNDNFRKVSLSREVDPIAEYFLEDMTDEEKWIHGWKSIFFVCDRGVSHEIVRHRDASFAQESTRYCNYSKDKFGEEITVIKPSMFEEDGSLIERQKYGFWKDGIKHAEDAYFYLLDMGATPQEARSVLPNSLKTEITVTMRNYELGHFIYLRGATDAHPQMRELAVPLYEKLVEENKKFSEYKSW